MSSRPLRVRSERVGPARPRRSRRSNRALLTVVCALAVLLGAGFGVLGGTDPAPVPTAGAATTSPVPGAVTGSTPSGSTTVPTASDPTASDPTAPDPTASAPTASAPTTSDPAGQPPGPVVVPTGSALAALATLRVAGRAPQTGYSRDQYGDGWVDTDRNGCDTRNDVLARDLTAEQFRPGTRDCVVTSGVLLDPYSGTTILFQRGQGISELVQIDHVVALSNSWQTGAQSWDAERREQFANDPLNLLAVDGSLNNQKRDGDTATWLPPDRGYRCAYVARQVAVKAAYGLWTTPAEHDAMATVLATCPDQPLPTAAPVG